MEDLLAQGMDKAEQVRSPDCLLCIHYIIKGVVV
jgi:hypothetical protein